MGKILITGASGFIGKNLISYLNSKNHKLKILYRNEKNLNYLKNYGEVFKVDLNSFSSSNDFLNDIDTIIHCAGSVRGNSYRDFYEGNVKTTENLIKLIKKERKPIKKFIFLSSLSASGPSKTNDLPSEDDEPHPVSDYGRSKLEAENLIRNELEMPFLILRLTGVYGPEDREIFKFFKYAHKGTLFLPFKKNQKIQLIYIKDVLRAIEKGILSDSTGVFFIANPEILNTIEISFFLKEIVGKSIKVITFPETLVKLFSYINLYAGKILNKKTMFNPQKVKEILSERWICSTQKANNMLKFNAEYSFASGARETYKWYLDQNWI